MPKKEKIYTKNINVRISKDQFDKWDKYAKNNGFDDISKLVRYATNGLIDGLFHKIEFNNEKESLRKKIEIVEENHKELLKTQNKILKLMAEKTSGSKDISLWDYLKTFALNLLEEKSRDEIELSKLLDLDEIKTLNLLNGFIELGKVKLNEEHKYELIL